MGTRVAERVDGWEQRSFSDGYRGLQDLADADFSGVVRAGGAELYMTKGTVVGIEGGAIEDFEGASGTSYRAPSPALPLLAVMQGRSDEVRAKYYTEETPMAEVDRTLSDGGFTGYVELSENVLSGDYYLVYHQGRSMSVAFVGNSQQLVDGDEAFETANDEVGIYEVRPVEVAAVEVPAPEPEPAPDQEPGPTPDAGSGAGAVGPAAGGAAGEGGGEDGGGGSQGEDGRTGAAEPEPPASESVGAGETAGGTTEGDDPGSERSGAARADQPAADADADRTGAGAAGGRDEPASGSAQPPEAAGRDRSESGRADRDRTEAGEEVTDPDSEPSGESPAVDPGREPEPGDSRGTPEQAAESAPGDSEAAPGQEAAGRSHGGTETVPGREPSTQSDTGPAERGAGERAGASAGAAGGATGPTGEDTGVALETRSVPSLDPQRTSENGRGDASAGAQPGPTRGTEAEPGPAAERPPSPASGPGDGASHEADRDPGPSGAGQSAADRDAGTAAGTGATGEAGAGDAADLRERLEDREAELDRLEAELAEETERREDLERELAEVREERDELAAEVERLEAELERVEEEFGVATGAQQRLTPAEALEGTDLFVRYRSKNGTTLTDAHGGDGRREDVTDNLRLEQHTQFDADDVAVDGQDYEAFIRGRVEYQFVTWLVEDLLFEVRDTGGAEGLADLYDALPEVDRAELNGTVAVRYTEDGTEQRGQETFDIVLRDRMGDPLFVANLNDSREGATEGMMEGLITAAERVGGSKDTLAGAFLVTESFFEPEALETAAESTKGGLLSRDKRKSFVNLSRKRGYHLCLVEARNQNFNLAVPEL